MPDRITLLFIHESLLEGHDHWQPTDMPISHFAVQLGRWAVRNERFLNPARDRFRNWQLVCVLRYLMCEQPFSQEMTQGNATPSGSRPRTAAPAAPIVVLGATSGKLTHGKFSNLTHANTTPRYKHCAGER